MPVRNPKLIWALAAVVGLLLAVWNPLAGSAAAFNRDVTVASAAIYGTLRSANAVMSVLKDADVQGSIGIASVSGSPGQVLQPITNTIDRMAGILFALAIAAGVLSTIMGPVATGSALLLVVGAGALAATAGSTGWLFSIRIRPLARSLVVVGSFGALVLPTAYTAAFVIGDRITATAWENASSVMARLEATYDQGTVEEQLEPAVIEDEASGAQTSATNAIVDEESSFFDRSTRALGSAIDTSSAAIQGTVAAASSLATSVTIDLREKTDAIRTALSISNDLLTASIQIAVSYLVKLIVLPIIIIVGGWFVLRASLRAGL